MSITIFARDRLPVQLSVVSVCGAPCEFGGRFVKVKANPEFALNSTEIHEDKFVELS
jgi:hypothetical protein